MSEIENNTRDVFDQERPILICPVYPTPNGNLHMGHISGPYLGADIFRRFCELKGRTAYLVCGTDDHQSYVVAKADQENSTPQEVVDLYACRIQKTFHALNIECDEFVQSSRCTGYSETVDYFFQQLHAKNAVTLKRSPQLIGSDNGYLFEPYISGICPTCKSSCGGNICEECGAPNLCIDLINPSTSSGEPYTRQELPSLQFNLAGFFDDVERHLIDCGADQRLIHLLSHCRIRGLDEFPVTHPQEWGISVEHSDLDTHVIWVWLEMACQMVFGQKCALTPSNAFATLPPESILEPHLAETVYFFGYDNSFYLSQLIPAALTALDPRHLENVQYVVNEFLLLDGEKFSTSRNHAVWADEMLDVTAVDTTRMFLSLVRPEYTRADFTWSLFADFVDQDLKGVWEQWFMTIQTGIDAFCDGKAPKAGSLGPEQERFWASMVSTAQSVETHYEAASFSPSTVMKSINAFAVEALRQSQRIEHLPIYMIPHQLQRLDAMPLLPNGKIDQASLRNLVDCKSLSTSQIGNETELIQSMLTRFLGDDAGQDATFVERGGTSLDAMYLVAEADRQFSRRLSAADILKMTSAEITDAIHSAARNEQSKSNADLDRKRPLRCKRCHYQRQADQTEDASGCCVIASKEHQ